MNIPQILPPPRTIGPGREGRGARAICHQGRRSADLPPPGKCSGCQAEAKVNLHAAEANEHNGVVPACSDSHVLHMRLACGVFLHRGVFSKSVLSSVCVGKLNRHGNTALNKCLQGRHPRDTDVRVSVGPYSCLPPAAASTQPGAPSPSVGSRPAVEEVGVVVPSSSGGGGDAASKPDPASGACSAPVSLAEPGQPSQATLLRLDEEEEDAFLFLAESGPAWSR